jgi:hypothetical protein
VIGAGGFDPYVSLFSGSGAGATFLASNDDGSCPPGTLGDGLCGDSTLVTGVLPAGTYTLAVSAFLNMSFAENLGSGTLGDGFIGLGSYGTRSYLYAVDIAGATLVTPTLALSHNPNGLTFGPQTVNVASGPLGVVVTNVGSSPVALGRSRSAARTRRASPRGAIARRRLRRGRAARSPSCSRPTRSDRSPRPSRSRRTRRTRRP